MLRLYAHSEARMVTTNVPAPCVEVARDVPNPTAASLRKRLGRSFDDEQDLWRAAKTASAAPFVHAGVLTQYFPHELWLVAGALIQDGPDIAIARLSAALEQERDRGLGQSALDIRRAMANRLLKAVADQAGLTDHPAKDVLGPWRGGLWRVPRVIADVRDDASDERELPPAQGHEVRRYFAQLDADVRRRLRMRPGDTDELAALRRLPRSYVLKGGGLATPLKYRALLAFLSCVGPRITCGLATTVGDFDRHRSHGAGQGPAVRIQPFKTEEGRRPRWKPVPVGLANLLSTYLAFREIQLGRPLTSAEPLFISHACEPLRAFTPGGARHWLYAKLLVNPHAMRKLTKVWSSSEGAIEVLRENGRHAGNAEPSGEALLDHGLDLSALYRGESKRAGRERLSAWATEVCWEMLTTRRGARRAVDEKRYQDAVRAESLLSDVRKQRQAALDDLCRAAVRDGAEVSATELVALSQEVNRIRDDLDDARAVITGIESWSLDYLKLIPDDSDAVPECRPLRELRAEALSHGAVRPGLPRRVRNWVTPKEFARLIGVSEASVRAWIANGLPRGKHWWAPDRSPVHRFSDDRRRALLVDRLNWEALNVEQRAALELLITEPAPDGWTRYAGIVPDGDRE